jgi:hypothetical protein
MTDLFTQPEQPMSTALVQHVDPTPMILLQQAIESGLNPDHLEKLMQLQERYERNQAEKQFASAMHECQQDMPKVVRNAQNKQTGSWYADLESVQAAARPTYTKHGFSLSYGEADCPVASFKRTVCDVRHVGGHSVRYHLDLPIDGVGAKGNAIGAMNPVQGCISTTSYGQRRLLCMIFNITLAGEDDDGQIAAKIGEEQIATLKEWMGLIGADEGRILKWRNVETWADLPAADFSIMLSSFKTTAKKNGLNTAGMMG